MLRKDRIKVGDQVPVALDGAIRQLEVVAVFRKPLLEKLFHFIMLNLYRSLAEMNKTQRVVVKTPTGEELECRLMRPALF